MNLVLTSLVIAVAAYLATTHLERVIMSSQQAAVDALVAQLRKSHQEIIGQLAAAHNSINSQLVTAGVEEQVDLSALTAIAQQLDDIVPDEVVDVVDEGLLGGVDDADEVDEVLEDAELLESEDL
jgi:hypothetical protein